MKKVIIYFLPVIFYLVSLQRVLVNIYFCNNENKYKSFVNEVFYTTGTDGYISIANFNVRLKDNLLQGSYNIKSGFNIEKGDLITYRRLYNLSNTIRVLKKNDIKLQSYYGVWDYVSLVITILVPIGITYLNKK